MEKEGLIVRMLRGLWIIDRNNKFMMNHEDGLRFLLRDIPNMTKDHIRAQVYLDMMQNNYEDVYRSATADDIEYGYQLHEYNGVKFDESAQIIRDNISNRKAYYKKMLA